VRHTDALYAARALYAASLSSLVEVRAPRVTSCELTTPPLRFGVASCELTTPPLRFGVASCELTTPPLRFGVASCELGRAMRTPLLPCEARVYQAI
jgi:hypothetical protein